MANSVDPDEMHLSCIDCYDKCNIQYLLIGNSTCDPLKHITDNPILIVGSCMGKSDNPESREKILQRQPHLQDLSPFQDVPNYCEILPVVFDKIFIFFLLATRILHGMEIF